MEQLKNAATTHAKKLQYVYLIGAGIAAINTLGRADYNFIIYLYMFYVTKYMENAKETKAQEKVASFFILLYSLFVDFFWCFYWGGKWGDLKNDPEHGIHLTVLVLSWIGILVKIVALFMIGFLDWTNIKASLPNQLKQKLNADYAPQVDDVIKA